jgi:hypothetical protein
VTTEEKSAPIAKREWFDFGRILLAAAVGAVLTVFSYGKAAGADANRLVSVERRNTDHEGRIRTLEGKVGDVAADVRWLREAVRTGRDPATGAVLPGK